MVEISIFCLIYRSKQYADFMHEQVYRFTPHVSDGRAEFFFIANDATPEILAYLKMRDYRHIINVNPMLTDDELFAKGIGCPEYMYRVYRGYNTGILASKGKIIVMLCSDQCLSPDWLENLLKYLAPGTCITSMSIERQREFPGTYHGNFGDHPSRIDYEYLNAVKELKTTGLVQTGPYMPLAMYREDAVKVGFIPEGNIAGSSFDDIPEQCGDERFIQNLRDAGIERYTSLDSIIYHIKEGERDEDLSTETTKSSKRVPSSGPDIALAYSIQQAQRQGIL